MIFATIEYSKTLVSDDNNFVLSRMTVSKIRQAIQKTLEKDFFAV